MRSKLASFFWVLMLFLGATLPGVFAFATGGVGVTYHGRLLKPDGSPVVSNSVQFKIQVRTPGAENCLLYEETYTKDLSTANGAFAITLNDGTATSLNTEPFTFDRIFQNRGVFTFAGGKCTAVGSYSPNAADGRRLSVEFNDGTFAGWETLPSQDVAFVPMAIESMTVGGYNADSLLKVVDGSGNPATATPLSPAQYTEFGNLLSGTSTQYLHAGGNSVGFTGSLAGDVTGTQGTTSVVKIQGRAVDTAAPANGQVLAWSTSNSRWEPTTAAASGVTNVATGTGLSGGPITGTGTISLANTTVTSGTYGSATQVPTFTVDAQGRLTSASVTTISGVAPGGAASGDLTGTYPSPTINAASVTGAKIAANTIGVGNLSTTGASTGQTYRYSGAAWTISKLGYTDLVNSFAASPWPTVTCTSGQFIIWQSSTDSFVCSSLTASQINTALTYTAANGANYVAKAGDTMTGALVLPSNGLTVGTSELTVAGSKVGIGTTSAAVKLEVAGTLKVADGGETCSIAANGGMVRYNSGSIQFCNGSSWQTLGVSGAGLTSLGGQTNSTQTFAAGTSGTSPAIVSASNVHTLNVPLASGAGVTSGTISKTEYDNFNTKLSAVSNTASLANTKIWVGDGTGKAQEVSVSGDATLANTGALTLNTVPITKGGTGQTSKTAAFDALSPLTTKGDLVVRDGSNNIRLAVGADGKFLKADSAQASGLAWSDVVATDLLSMVTTGIVQRNGSNSYSSVTVNSPLTYSAGALGVNAAAGGVLMDGGNTTAATVSVGTKDANDLALTTNNTVKMTVQAGGNVGIGTTTPNNALSIQANNTAVFNQGLSMTTFENGTGMSGSGIRVSSIRGTAGAPTATISGDQLGALGFGGYWTGKSSTDFGQGQARAGLSAYSTENWTGASNNGAELRFHTTDTGTSSVQERLRIQADGKVGIGTTSPGQALTVNGTIESLSGGIKFPDGSVQLSSATTGINNSMNVGIPDAIRCQRNDGLGENTFYISNPSGSASAMYVEPSTGTYLQFSTATGNYISCTAGSSTICAFLSTSDCANTSQGLPRLYSVGRAFNFAKGPAGLWLQTGSDLYYNAGKVGIGTATPALKFEVYGTSGNTLKIVDGNQAVGRVLTSDANGVASWAAASGGGSVTGVTATAPVASTGGTAPVISMPAATTSQDGYLTSANWNTFNGKASLASPTFTGTPLAPTAAVNTNTTQIATTAFVLGQLSSTTPLMDGVAAVGTGTTFARGDHVHPTDTSRAPASGSTSITTLGTITTGTWNGSTIPVAYGGTGTTTGSITGTGALTFTAGGSNQNISLVPSGTGSTILGGSVGIGTTTPAASAALDVNSTTAGLLPPRMTTAQRDAIVSPAAGLVIYNSTNSRHEYYTGSAWLLLGASGSAVSPAGMVGSFSMATCPSGWILANGSAISRTTYSDLFGVVGTMYGVGDGSTTFNLPDYRGYFLRGLNNGSGNDPDAASRTNRGDGTTGDAVGTKQAGQLQSHTHDNQMAAIGTAGGSAWAWSGANTGNSTGAAGGNETRPKNINVVYCVSTAAITATTVASGGSGTTNYIPVWTGATALGNSPVAVNGSNVGIGTTAPLGKLDVSGSLYTGTGTLVIRDQGTANEGGEIDLVGQGSNNGLVVDNWGGNLRFFSDTAAADKQVQVFNSGSSSKMGLYVEGKVGIGTTTPSVALEVSGPVMRTIAHSSGAGPDATSDTGNSGQVTSRTLSFTKAKAGTSIRIGWSDARRAYSPGGNGACRWEIKVDGNSCSAPLIFDVYTSGNIDHHRSDYVMGYCDGLSAGAHTIQVWVTSNVAGSYLNSMCYTGWAATRWTLEAEEVN